MIEPNNYAVYKYDNDNKSCCLVRIDDIVNDERGVAKITVIKVFKDDSGNGLFNYLEETGKQMNAGTKYLHPIDSLLARLAAYEDTGLSPEEIREMMTDWLVWKQAEAEGRHVVLPCKVGDMVYAVFEEQGILSLTVKRFLLSEYGLFITTPHGLYHTERFGKTVFLSREDAETALEAQK